MKVGNLIIYDYEGKIFLQTGISTIDVKEHDIPVGIPYIIIPYDDMFNKNVVGIDISNGVENPIPIFEDVVIPKTEEQLRIEELENQLLLAEGVI